MKIDYDMCKIIINGIILSIIVFNHLKIIQIPLFPLKMVILLMVVFNVWVMTKKNVGLINYD